MYTTIELIKFSGIRRIRLFPLKASEIILMYWYLNA